MTESEVLDVRIGDEHITPEQIMDVNIGTYGPGDYVIPTGKKLEAQLISNNTVRIFDGVMVYNGVRDVIAVNNYHDIAIENGSQGMNRNDIIVRHFSKSEETQFGEAEFQVIKGTPASVDATDPSVSETNLRDGDLTHDMKLYRVRLEGLNVVGLDPLFEELPSIPDLKEDVESLNGNNKAYKWEQTAAPYGSGTMTVSIYRIGRSCFANVTWTGSTLQNGETLGEFSIPAAFRPIAGAYGSCMNVVGTASAETSTRIWITNNGTVQYVTDDTRSVERRMSISYLAASAALPGDEYLM